MALNRSYPFTFLTFFYKAAFGHKYIGLEIRELWEMIVGACHFQRPQLPHLDARDNKNARIPKYSEGPI